MLKTMTSSHEAASPRISVVRTAVIAILVVGFLVRIWAIDFGLPYPYNIDEPAYTNAAWNLACFGNLDSSLLQPQTYLYTVSLFVLRLVPGGVSCEPTAIASLTLLVGRFISMIMGLASVWLTYRLGQTMFNSYVGAIGGLFLALNFLHVRESHFGTPDMTGVFLVLAAFLAYKHLADAPVVRNYILAALFTALAISARPTFLLLGLPFAYAHFYAQGIFRNPSWQTLRRAVFSRNLFLAGGLLILVLVLLTPQLWLNFQGFRDYWGSFFRLGRLGGFGRFMMSDISAPLFYLQAMNWGSGTLLLAAMAVGGLWAIYRRTFSDVLILSFVAAYAILALSSSVYFARYAIPVLPLLGLLAARIVWEVLSKLQRPALAPLVAILLILQPTLTIIRFDNLLTQTDSRTLAHDWIQSQIPAGTKIAAEIHTPFIEGYDLTVVDIHGSWQTDMETYREQGFQYLIVSSYIRDISMIVPEEEAQKVEFYNNLGNEAELVMEFRPYSGPTAPPYLVDQVLGPLNDLEAFDRPGPTIQIYRLGDSE
jgi:hypothetical protein